MKIKIIPRHIESLKDLRLWVDENITGTDTVIGVSSKCRITELKEFSEKGPRWNTYTGIPLYFNF